MHIDAYGRGGQMQPTCGNKRTTWKSWCLLPTWAVGIELRSSVLAVVPVPAEPPWGPRLSLLMKELKNTLQRTQVQDGCQLHGVYQVDVYFIPGVPLHHKPYSL